MATQTPQQQHQQQEPTTATITINDHTPNPNNNIYDVIFNNTTIITTTVTNEPSIVTSWITTLLSSPTLPKFIGLDVEWRPNFSKNHDNPVATLQLCTNTNTNDSNSSLTCLIFQIIHCPTPIPKVLIDLLLHKDLTFVGVGIKKDVERLLVDYDLGVGNMLDLGKVAREKRVQGLSDKSTSIGLKELARVVLGFNVNKPKKVTMSRWDQGWLSYVQIQYACVDAFLSFQIAATLFGLGSGSGSSSSS